MTSYDDVTSPSLGATPTTELMDMPRDSSSSSSSSSSHAVLNHRHVSLPVVDPLSSYAASQSQTFATVPVRSTADPASLHPSRHPHVVRTFAGGLVRYWEEPAAARASWHPHLAERVQSYASVQQWKARLQLALFADVAIWKAAALECLGTHILTFMILMVVTGVLNHKEDYSYFPTAIAVWHIPLVAFMILATATATGGHLNPMISFSTCLAGLTEFPRMVLYIPAQIVGSIIAAYTAKHLTPSALLPVNMLAMCSIGTDQSVAQAFTMEVFCDLFVLFVAFGVALDERQRQAMPPWFPPFVISTMIAMLIYTTSTISTFSNGAIAFPTRCFAPAVAMGLVTADSFQIQGPNGLVTVNNAQWIYWIGPLAASLIIAFFYRTVPPGYTMIVAAERRQSQVPQREDLQK